MATNTAPSRRFRTVIALLVAALVAATGSIATATSASAVAQATVQGQINSVDLPVHGLHGVTVHLWNNNGTFGFSTTTDSTGHYTLSVPSGAPGYRVEFNTQSEIGVKHVSEFYPHIRSFNDAPTQVFTSGATVTINASLDLAGSISGNVTGNEGYPDAQMNAYWFNPVSSAWEIYGSAYSDATTGDYTIPQLATGTYKVLFDDVGGHVYGSELYDNKLPADFAGAMSVSVTGGTNTPGIDAALTPAGPVVAGRLWGTDRFETAIAVSGRWAPFVSPAGVVYVANGFGFADALSAAPAAAHLGGPLLLTQQNVLPPAVATEIQRLHPHRIVVVGGTGVISDAVVTQLVALAPVVDRYAGVDRYDTSRKVTADAFAAGTTTTAFIATGTGFPDALSASAAAAHLGAPVILVDGSQSTVPQATADLIVSLGVTLIHIAGGSGVVSAGMETALAQISGNPATIRHGGVDRYETSLLINEAVFTTPSRVYLAVGTGFADALAGAALAGRDGSPLLVVPATCLSSDELSFMQYGGTTVAMLFGGTGSLSLAVENLDSCTPYVPPAGP